MVTQCRGSTTLSTLVTFGIGLPYCGTLVSVSRPPFPSWSCTNWQADPLAYPTAKTNGLEEEAAEILEVAGLIEANVDDVPSYG